MKNQIKLIVGTRLVLCSRVVQGKVTFLKRIQDLGDARHNGFDYTIQSQALYVAAMRVKPNDFWKSATSFVEPLIIN